MFEYSSNMGVFLATALIVTIQAELSTLPANPGSLCILLPRHFISLLFFLVSISYPLYNLLSSISSLQYTFYLARTVWICNLYVCGSHCFSVVCVWSCVWLDLQAGSSTLKPIWFCPQSAGVLIHDCLPLCLRPGRLSVNMTEIFLHL